MTEFQAVQPFIGSRSSSDQSDILIWGIGFDGTTSFRPGARFAPGAIRQASDGLELYSPGLDIDLETINYHDLGDLNLPIGDTKASHDLIRQTSKSLILEKKGKLLTFGGEHSITPPIVDSYLLKYPDLVVIQFDAHCDLRESYIGVPFSHACVMHQISQKIGFERIKQIGIRSGTKQEFSLLHKHNTLLCNPLKQLPKILKEWSDKPIYITLDLDVLDPGSFPGTGTPEPGGLYYQQLEQLLHSFQNYQVVGIDIVELSPTYDPSGISSVVAAKLARESIAILNC